MLLNQPYGQSQDIDSLVVLPIVEVSVTPLKSTVSMVNLDEEDLQNKAFSSVAEALASNGLVFIKSYGIGSLATLSLRGGTAGQTSIFWNEMPVQSPMLGLTDLSLLPVSDLGELRVRYGGHSAESGSGAVSGGVYLESNTPIDGWCIGSLTELGSFGQLRQELNVERSNDKWGIKLSGNLVKADNDFPYQINESLPVKRLQHALLEQHSAQQRFHWHINNRHSLFLYAWQGHSYRQLPPITTQNRSEAEQYDEFYRQQILWKAYGRQSTWEARVGLNHEKILYRDAEDIPSHFSALIVRAKRMQSINNRFDLETGIQLNNAWASIDSYRGIRKQLQIGGYQKASWALNNRWNIDGALRLEHVHHAAPIVSGHLGTTFQLPKDWQLSLRGSRDFRIPTLNDLYWVPGGNLDLETEKSWGQELNIVKQWATEETQKMVSTALFNRLATNWIQWAISPGDIFWSASNIAEVWSRGGTAHVQWQWNRPLATIRADIRYSLTLSTFLQGVQSLSINKGDQLWYTPIHRSLAALAYKHKRWGVRYSHRWISENRGVNGDLEAYHIGDWSAHWKGKAKWKAVQVYAAFNNAWNTNYRIVERRPMPGRNGRLGLKLKFNQD